MARDFIIKDQKVVTVGSTPVFDGDKIPLLEVEGQSLMINVNYEYSAGLPMIYNINGPVSLRGTVEPYFVFTTKEE